MTREDAIFFLNGLRSNNNCDETIDMAIAALRGPQPDPDTGLVPCGCGGRAFVYCPVDMTDVFVIRCEKCRVGITFAMDLPRAKKEWNTAMGWRVEG